MPAPLGTFRRVLLTPSLAKVSFRGRGFPGATAPAAARLEAIPQSVIAGFEWGIESRTLWEIERRLELVDPEMRGFAYEGATMALTVRDSVRGHRTRDLLLGSGQPHIFLTYIGIGFAMARLPRPLWRKVLPDLSGSPYFPTMSWLAVDGYGFDRAYFDTKRIVEQQRVLAPYPWAGDANYFPRAVDQGIGRALWFIHGGVAREVTAAVRRFDPRRQADLWSGVGLAATFAGGSPADALAELAASAGEHEAEVALGAIFAAKARTYSGFVPGHTHDAIRALSGLDLGGAVALADRTEVPAEGDGPVPQYELWRRNIREQVPAATRSAVV
jgi:hypothetical protein